MLAGASGATAANKRFYESLRKLDPETRLEQVCDLEAMSRIGKDDKSFRPDRAETNVVSPPRVSGDTLQGKGGAFRSKGKWYAFSFACKASPDRMRVLSFTYKVGEAIPKEKWQHYGLWE